MPSHACGGHETNSSVSAPASVSCKTVSVLLLTTVDSFLGLLLSAVQGFGGFELRSSHLPSKLLYPLILFPSLKDISFSNAFPQCKPPALEMSDASNIYVCCHHHPGNQSIANY